MLTPRGNQGLVRPGTSVTLLGRTGCILSWSNGNRAWLTRRWHDSDQVRDEHVVRIRLSWCAGDDGSGHTGSH